MWRIAACCVISQRPLTVSIMTEYALNQMPPSKLAEFALNSATFVAVVAKSSLKLELYYLNGYFIEISYSLKKRPGQTPQWQLYSANHFPDVPDSTKYLTIYLEPIKLSID